MDSREDLRLPAARPREVALLDQVLASSGRIVPASEFARSGKRYRLVDRGLLITHVLQLVDAFVTERVRQVERDMAQLIDAREAQAFADGRDRTLSSLATLADLVDNVVASMGGGGDHIALRALSKRIDAIFKTHGYSRIETVGRPFDSRQHEVVEERSEPGAQSQIILQEVSRGYAKDGYVLLVAKVVVAA